MAHDHARAWWITTSLQISNFLALVIAGAWVFYTFVLKESSKTHYIFPSVQVLALDPPKVGADGSMFRAFELGLTVNNASERDVYIVVATASAFGHTAKAVSDKRFGYQRFFTKNIELPSKDVKPPSKDIKLPPEDTKLPAEDTKLPVVDGPQLMMRQATWSGRSDEFATLITFPSYDLARGETAVQQYVLLAPSAEYDILEIWMEFHVVDACPGIFGARSCFEFGVQYNAAGVECNAAGQKCCNSRAHRLAFYYSERGRDAWEKICEEDLRSRFNYKNFQTTRMIIPPDAPILKTPKTPR